MRILKELLESVEGDCPVRELRIGTRFTAVASRSCGLASTMMRECRNEDGMRESGLLTRMSAGQLAAWSLSDMIHEASVGLAALNSLMDVDRSKCADLNAAEIIREKGRGGNISVIGHFPFVDDLKSIAKNVWVMEKFQRPGDFPEQSLEEFLPRSGVIAVSGTTLINHTFEKILSLCPRGSIKIILGATTPMSSVFFDYGIDYVSGCEVRDADAVLKLVAESATFRQIKQSGGVALLTMSRDGH